MTNFRLLKTARGCKDNFNLMKMTNSSPKGFSKRVENIVGKGEIARNEQFLLLMALESLI